MTGYRMVIFYALLLSTQVLCASSSKIEFAPPEYKRTDKAGCYIVKLNDGVDEARQGKLYELLKGFDEGNWIGLKMFTKCGVQLDDIESFADYPEVSLIEEDMVAHTVETCENLSLYNDGPWGLDRIDQRSLPLDDQFCYSHDGTGVTIYIVDTGIYNGNVDFNNMQSTSRIAGGISFVPGTSSSDWVDTCNGHGTHVSGIAAGTAFGAAKNAWLFAVRVLDCSGSGAYSTVIAGLNYVLNNGQHPGVINLSLGGPKSTAVNSAVASLINSNFHVAVAAGNSGKNACSFSPASASVYGAITAAASDIGDHQTSWSNYGTCVTLVAPGNNIESDWITSPTATAYLSGTSMSSPHVAGTIAEILTSNPTMSPQSLKSYLVSTATPNVLSNVPHRSPNLLLFNGGGQPARVPGGPHRVPKDPHHGPDDAETDQLADPSPSPTPIPKSPEHRRPNANAAAAPALRPQHAASEASWSALQGIMALGGVVGLVVVLAFAVRLGRGARGSGIDVKGKATELINPSHGTSAACSHCMASLTNCEDP